VRGDPVRGSAAVRGSAMRGSALRGSAVRNSEVQIGDHMTADQTFESPCDIENPNVAFRDLFGDLLPLPLRGRSVIR
jgi:hypothetical protein